MGKHAGGYHPANFEDAPLSRNWALFEAGEKGHGKHADDGDYMAEVVAWEMEVEYL